MAAYPHLFLPLKVGSHFLKNRIVMAPVETGLEKQDYFDPRSNSVTLSPEAFDGLSLIHI